MFPLFLKGTGDVLASSLCAGFRRLLRLGSFQACWRQANATPIPKGNSFLADYQPILITSVCIVYTAFALLVSVHLGRFMERSGVLPTTQFAYRKGVGTCDAHLCLSHILQSPLESGQEARIVQIDFSAVFDRVNHQGILDKFGYAGIIGFVFSQFLSNRSLHVMVDGCRSKLVGYKGVIYPKIYFVYYLSDCVESFYTHVFL